MKMKTLLVVAGLAILNAQAFADARPRPVPNARLKARLATGCEIIGIVHWGLNTFTDKEWGYGDEKPEWLDPSAFDADQIVGAAKAGGIGGLVVVAKHHDGFCLWPTKTTQHNITKSPFRGGKGDYVREMEQACRRAGVRFGVYCSPWDRNSAHYATERYVEIYHAQLRELLGGAYGEIFEMWFDGANGGDGHYGGARERRKIGDNYYRFDKIRELVYGLQPKTCTFGLEEFSWPGNEQGLIRPEARAIAGNRFSIYEADFPLRPGWFYHAKEKGRTRHGAYLMKLYLSSVGNGGVMNIGLAPDRRGLLDDEDVRALRDFKVIKDAFFSREVKADGEAFNVVVLCETLDNGEQVDGWEFLADGKPVLTGETIGLKRIRILDKPVAAAATRLKVTKDGGRLLPIAVRRYLADPELVKEVLSSTTTSGETDTAKWMTGQAEASR